MSDDRRRAAVKLFPRNADRPGRRTSCAATRSRPGPRAGVDNCFPGLEFDQRNLDKRSSPASSSSSTRRRVLRAIDPDGRPPDLRPWRSRGRTSSRPSALARASQARFGRGARRKLPPSPDLLPAAVSTSGGSCTTSSRARSRSCSGRPGSSSRSAVRARPSRLRRRRQRGRSRGAARRRRLGPLRLPDRDARRLPRRRRRDRPGRVPAGRPDPEPVRALAVRLRATAAASTGRPTSPTWSRARRQTRRILPTSSGATAPRAEPARRADRRLPERSAAPGPRRHRR